MISDFKFLDSHPPTPDTGLVLAVGRTGQVSVLGPGGRQEAAA